MIAGSLSGHSKPDEQVVYTQEAIDTRVWESSPPEFDGEPLPVYVPVFDKTLSKQDLEIALYLTGWPRELWDQAGRVVECESRYHVDSIGDHGNSLGLFQLNKDTWFRYAGTDVEQWDNPLVNAQTALATYWYDVGRGYAPWTQWSCKP